MTAISKVKQTLATLKGLYNEEKFWNSKRLRKKNRLYGVWRTPI